MTNEELNFKEWFAQYKEVFINECTSENISSKTAESWINKVEAESFYDDGQEFESSAIDAAWNMIYAQ